MRAGLKKASQLLGRLLYSLNRDNPGVKYWLDMHAKFSAKTMEAEQTVLIFASALV